MNTLRLLSCDFSFFLNQILVVLLLVDIRVRVYYRLCIMFSFQWSNVNLKRKRNERENGKELREKLCNVKVNEKRVTLLWTHVVNIRSHNVSVRRVFSRREDVKLFRCRSSLARKISLFLCWKKLSSFGAKMWRIKLVEIKILKQKWSFYETRKTIYRAYHTKEKKYLGKSINGLKD